MLLIREESPLIDYWQGKESSPEDREILSANIKEDGLKFFYAQQKSASLNDQSPTDAASAAPEDMAWKGRWDQNGLPSGIRVRLSFQTPDSQKTLELFEDVFIPSGESIY